MKILIADDTAINIKQLEAVCTRLGHEVVTAGNGREAVERYQATSPDLVFMDIMMPEMDGIEAVRQIRALPTQRWVPIIFFSALDTIDDVVRGLEAGGDDYLTKPLSVALVRAKINGFGRALGMQSQLILTTQELAKWREEAEEQHELGTHVLSRLVEQDGLRDPMLRWLNLPAQTFSGDLICAARTPDGVLYVMLADATGHGLAAALTALPLTHTFYGMTAKGFPIRSIVAELNSKVKQLMPSGRFVAATLASIDARNKTIEVWNGGNPAALMVDHGGSIVRKFSSSHLPLGILSTRDMETHTATEHYKGEVDLLIFSDGLLEAESPTGEALGMAGILACLAEAPSDSRFEYLQVKAVVHVDAIAGHDDISLMQVHAPDTVEVDSQLRPHRAVTAVQAVTDWRLELSWGMAELRSIDIVPIVMDMLGRIASLAAHQSALFMVISELYNNALDHGLLSLDSGLKDAPDGYEHYLELREQRLAETSSGRIDMLFHLHMAGDQPVFDITFADSGPGFDYSNFMNSERGQFAQHGRGIRLVHAMCETVTFAGTGNRVSARYHLGGAVTKPS